MFNVYEAVDELIEDINVEYHESCYDAIYEELCNRVECGELTIEEAEMINDAAAEKYLTEGNAFNRVLNDKLSKREKLDKRLDALKDLSDSYNFTNSGPVRKADLDQSSRIKEKIKKTSSLREREKEEGQMTGYRYKQDPASYIDNQNIIKRYPNNQIAAEARKGLRFAKQDWMQGHGNKGLRPEERYVAGRYLKAQQKLNSK